MNISTGPASVPSGYQLLSTGGAGTLHKVGQALNSNVEHLFDFDVDYTTSLTSEKLHESENEQSAPSSDVGNGQPHYFVHIPNALESTYDASERNIPIDPDFHEQLQQEGEREKRLVDFLHCHKLFLQGNENANNHF